MATGLNIRDFVKREREATYSLQGSFSLSEIEKNAYRNALTIEVLVVDGQRYFNLSTLPENTHWGQITQFRGSTVISNQAQKFVKYRVFDIINNGIWNYHQAQENVEVLVAVMQEIGNQVADEVGSEGGDGGILGIVIAAISGVGNLVEPALNWLVRTFVGGSDPEGSPAQDYTAFPVASPFPDIVKFKADLPLAFVFRLESWYLVNPAIYITSNPTDTSDSTDGEDEYPDPDAGDGDGDGTEFPPSSAPPSGSDPRDFNGGVSSGSGRWNVALRFNNGGNNPACSAVPVTTVTLRGFPDESPQLVYTGPPSSFGGRPGRIFTSVAELPFGSDCLVTINSLPVFFSD